MTTPEGDPADGLPGGMPHHPECPFCGGRTTELVSTFGSQLSVSTFWCRPCRSPFEFMKWGGEPAPEAPVREGEGA